MASRRQIAANRQNGLKGGVKTAEGKAISRLNARKHSIFVSALTPEDSEEVCGIEDQLIASLRPVGRVEEMLVEKVALTWLRLQRCARAEAEYHIRTWEQPNPVLASYEWEQLEKKRRCKARAVPFQEEVFERMVKLIDLYDARLTNQLLKLLHEIERLQRLRKGEDVPPPVVADLTIQADAGGMPQPPEGAVCSAPAPSFVALRATTEGEGGTAASQQAPDGATADAQATAPAPLTPPAEEDLTLQAKEREAMKLAYALRDEASAALARAKSQDGDGQEDNARETI